MALQDGIDFPESEDVLFRQQSSLTPCSIQHRTGMALEGGGGGGGKDSLHKSVYSLSQ